MRKLRRAEVTAIVTRLDAGHTSVCGIARAYGVSDRWVREIRRRWERGEALPVRAPGRKPRPVPEEERASSSAARTRST